MRKPNSNIPTGVNPYEVNDRLSTIQMYYDEIIYNPNGDVKSIIEREHTQIYKTTMTEVHSDEYNKAILSLKPITLRVFEIIKRVYLHKDKNYVNFHLNKFSVDYSIGMTSLYNALNELTSKGMLAKTDIGKGVYWINTFWFFKGNLKTYQERNDRSSIDYRFRLAPKAVDVKGSNGGGIKTTHKKHMNDMDKHFNQ